MSDNEWTHDWNRDATFPRAKVYDAEGPVYLKPACRGLDLIVNGESYDINDFVPHGDYIATIVLIGHEESSDSQHTERVVRDDELA